MFHDTQTIIMIGSAFKKYVQSKHNVNASDANERQKMYLIANY